MKAKKLYIKPVLIIVIVVVFLAILFWMLVPKNRDRNKPEYIFFNEPPASSGVYNLPPKNPYLADSSYSIPHGNSAQQDAVVVAGPEEQRETEDLIEKHSYLSSGPFQFGQFTTNEYSDGRRVLWASGADRVVKIDYDTHQLIDEYRLSPDLYYQPSVGEEIIDNLNNKSLVSSYVYILKDLAPMLMDLSGVYSLVDLDNEFYTGGPVNEAGQLGITVYGDKNVGIPGSEIIIKRKFLLPEEATGAMVGMNMTFDGRLVVATEHGWVIVVERDFSDYEIIRMTYAEDAAEDCPVAYGWVRNTFAVDKDGGIYIISNDYMHKIIWTGERLSIDEKDGAWVEKYSNTRCNGSGSTPSLMGFGDEDCFVVITDGDKLMNVVLYWRDEIPLDWEQIPGTSSRRVAGILPADMGGLVDEIQSEQSVVVMKHGAVIVNNEPRNMPDWLRAIDPRVSSLIVGFIGNRDSVQPYGIQKMQWNPEKQALENSWVTTRLSSLNALPIASYGSNMLYTIGASNGLYSLEGVDWDTGESVLSWELGDHRYNSLFSGILIDEDGRIHYTTLWGKVRFN